MIALDRSLNALAHPVRRAILERVMRREVRVTELAAPFDMSLNAVSKHIRVLEGARLVRRRRVWREHLVSFNPRPLEEVSAWIEKSRAFWSPRLDALEAALSKEEMGQEEIGEEAAAVSRTPNTVSRTRNKGKKK